MRAAVQHCKFVPTYYFHRFSFCIHCLNRPTESDRVLLTSVNDNNPCWSDMELHATACGPRACVSHSRYSRAGWGPEGPTCPSLLTHYDSLHHMTYIRTLSSRYTDNERPRQYANPIQTRLWESQLTDYCRQAARRANR